MTKDNGVKERFRERFYSQINKGLYVDDLEAFILDEVQRGKEDRDDEISSLYAREKKIHDHYREEIRRLREAYPYRGTPFVTVEKDNTRYRVMITKKFDTPEGLIIEGKI